MASQHSTTADFSSRYKFNGKELDKETGWYYYGARYYDPQVSTWLSVDPLAEKYIGFSPYNFTLGNPVILIDTNGMGVDKKDWEPVKGQPGKWKAQEDDSAASLAKDAGISYQKANNLVQKQLGKNKVVNGKEYSNVKPGDVVDVDFEKQAKEYLSDLNKIISKTNEVLSAVSESAKVAQNNWDEAYKELEAAKETWGKMLKRKKLMDALFPGYELASHYLL